MSVRRWVLDPLDSLETVVSWSLILRDVLNEWSVDVQDALDDLSTLLIESFGVTSSWGAHLFLSLAVWEHVHFAWADSLPVSLCSGQFSGDFADTMIRAIT